MGTVTAPPGFGPPNSGPLLDVPPPPLSEILDTCLLTDVSNASTVAELTGLKQ